MSRRVGASDTTTYVVLGLAGLAAVYFITRPKVTAPPIVTLPAGYVNPATAQTQQTTAIVNAGSSVLNNILSLFS